MPTPDPRQKKKPPTVPTTAPPAQTGDFDPDKLGGGLTGLPTVVFSGTADPFTWSFILPDPHLPTMEQTERMHGPFGSPLGGQQMTIDEATSFITTLNEDQLIELQRKLYSAGLFDDSFYKANELPQWGVVDPATMDAYNKLVSMAALSYGTGKGVPDILAELTTTSSERIGRLTSGEGERGPVYNITTTDPAELRKTVDQIAKEELGQKLPAKARDRIVDAIADSQRGQQQKVISAQEAGRTETAGSTSVVEGELDRFASSLRKMESGGNYKAVGPPTKYGTATGAYQFLDSTWNNYKGYRRAADAPPEVQDERAHQLMSAYYKQFGDWKLVAIAWHAGPGVAVKAQRDGRAGTSDVNMSTDDYAAAVVSGMGGGSTSVPLPGGTASSRAGTTIETQTVSTGAQAIEQVREQDPVLAGAHDQTKAYGTFLKVLGVG